MKPNQKVILYTKGLRKKTQAEYHNEWRLKQEGYFKCPGCQRAVRKGPAGKLKKHYSDFPNKIHCPEGVDRSNMGGGRLGVKRGPYKPRQGKNVYDT